MRGWRVAKVFVLGGRFLRNTECGHRRRHARRHGDSKHRDGDVLNRRGPPQTATTPPAIFTVAELINVTLVSQDAANVAVGSPDSNRALSFLLTNTGNGPETFSLAAITRSPATTSIQSTEALAQSSSKTDCRRAFRHRARMPISCTSRAAMIRHLRPMRVALFTSSATHLPHLLPEASAESS